MKIINSTNALRPRQLLMKEYLKSIGFTDAGFEIKSRINLIKNYYKYGIRLVDDNDSAAAISFQTLLNRGKGQPYLAEIDVPLGLFRYKYEGYKKHKSTAVECLKSDNLKKIIVFSEWAKKSFGLYFGEQVEAKCKVIYPYVEEHVGLQNREKRFDFCFISKNFSIKGGLQAYEAFNFIKKASKSAKMLFITNLKEASKKIDLSQRDDQISWVDSSIPHSDILKYLAESRILVHPTMMDSFAMVVLEAISMGCSVISTKTASIPEMVIDGYNGYILDAPYSAVSGLSFIPEYGDFGHFKATIDRFSLHRFLRDLTAAMETALLRSDQLSQNSILLHKERFDRRSFSARVNEALGELHT